MNGPDAPTPEMRTLLSLLRKDPLGLDEHTAERLLTNALPADDAPPPYRTVARVIEALAQEPTAAELDAEHETVLGITAAIASAPAPRTRRSAVPAQLLSPRRLTALVAATGVALFGGLAAAGALPGAAQEAASDALEKVGISVPNPNDASNGHADTRGKSGDHPAVEAEDDEGAEPDASNGKGAEISETARTTENTGVDKGAEISDAASDGKSHAGEEHPGADVPPSVPVGPPSQADEGLGHRP
jgi:hypothetical protein